MLSNLTHILNEYVIINVTILNLAFRGMSHIAPDTKQAAVRVIKTFIMI